MGRCAKKFGKNLQEVRKKLGLNQEELAELIKQQVPKAKTTKSSVSGWESGDHIPGDEILDALEDILRTDIGVLFLSDMEKRNKPTLDQALEVINNYEKPLRFSIPRPK